MIRHRIKQPISYRRKVILGIIGITVLIAWYLVLSHRQHQRNPRDTTLPNMRQLAEGFRIATTPETDDLKDIFKTEVKKESWVGDILALDPTGLLSWIGEILDAATKTMLFKDSTATYGRLLHGLLWGCVISVVLGILMGCYESVASALYPPLSFLAKVPGTAMLAVFFVMVGTGESMFVTMIAFGVLPTLTQAIYLSARDDLHDEEIDKAYTLGGSNGELICNVVYPQIVPKILDSVRLQIGPAMVYLIAAEMLVGHVGMGYQIRMQQRLLHMNVVYDYLLILGVTGLLMDKGLIMYRQWLSPWFDRGKR